MNIKCKCCTKAKELIQEWLDKQGHDKCWYYPEIFQQLAEIFNIKQNVDSTLPHLEEFKEGCRRYQCEQYKDESK